MPRRLALLIGNTKFENSKSFPPLRTPINDVQDFAAALQKHGDFEIFDTLIDAKCETINQQIENLFNKAERDDLILFYYSGHGYRGSDGHHYLVALNTHPDLLRSTGVSEAFIQDIMSISRSQQRIVILDCCFSGAFAEGRKSGVGEPLQFDELRGEATAILASSGTIQYSFEEKGRNSLFTRFLLGGIETGEADQDEDGGISVDELFNYAESRVRAMRPEQKPVKNAGANEDQICIARSPDGAAVKRYNLPNIRALLTEGFSGDELRDFMYDELRPAYDEISEETGKKDLIQKLIECAEQKVLFDTVLAWAKSSNETQYDKHKPYYHKEPLPRDQAPLPKPEVKAEEKPAFYYNRIFYALVGLVGLVVLGVIAAAFWLGPPNPPTPTPATRGGPGISVPLPAITVEKLEEDLNREAADPLQPRRGDYIAVPSRVHTVGRTEFVTNYQRYLWLFVCKRVQGDIFCQAQELRLTASGRWDDFVDIGADNPQDDCGVFEISFVVLNEQAHEQFSQIANGPVAEANLPGGEERVRFEAKRELDSLGRSIACEALARAASVPDPVVN
ncbi:MAG: caspase family protein [Anaerolineales bacterium]|nr:caspase family protein [Anaerolineales bacterium]